MNAGRRIRLARRHAGLWQSQLAVALGVSQALVCMIEKGRVGVNARREREIMSVIATLGEYLARVRSTVSSVLPSLEEVGRRAHDDARREPTAGLSLPG